MIETINIGKKFATEGGDFVALKSVTFSLLRGEKIGIIGNNGAGKSTLIKILSGAMRPSWGQLKTSMTISWPLAFGGAFQSGLTGKDNIKLISRIYGIESRTIIKEVEDFAELGKFIHEPIKNYSSGMRARLAFGLSMAVNFDCFLIDESVSVGDARFQEKCEYELFIKRKMSSMIIVSHDVNYVNNHCDKLAVLKDGQLVFPESKDLAFSLYKG